MLTVVPGTKPEPENATVLPVDIETVDVFPEPTVDPVWIDTELVPVVTETLSVVVVTVAVVVVPLDWVIWPTPGVSSVLPVVPEVLGALDGVATADGADVVTETGPLEVTVTVKV